LHRAGELTAIRVPSPGEEPIRDLVRVREDIKDDRRTTQHRVKSFLLRQGRLYPGRDKGWSDRFDLWAPSQRFEEPAADAAYRHYLAALDVRKDPARHDHHRDRRRPQLPPLAEPVGKLRCLRGIQTLSAVSIGVQVCDFRRFPRAASFMAFTELVPSEQSSGPSVHRGSITKTGNAHVRRVLVEAAWSYRHRPAIGINLRRRSEGQPPDVLAYACAAQCRLVSRFHSIASTKNRNVAVVAVARELSGVHLWAHDRKHRDRVNLHESERAQPTQGSSRRLCEFRSAPISQRQPPSEPVNCRPDPRIREWSIAACHLPARPHFTPAARRERFT